MARALKIIGFILSIVCLGAIVYLAFAGNVRVPEALARKDKLGHFLAYTALGFLFFLSFCSFSDTGFFRRNILSLLGAFMLSFACGYAIELCQPSFGRHFELLDLAADRFAEFAERSEDGLPERDRAADEIADVLHARGFGDVLLERVLDDAAARLDVQLVYLRIYVFDYVKFLT